MINTAIIRGRLGNDAKISTGKNGRNLARFSVAVSDSWKNDAGEWHERTHWIPVVTFQDGLVNKVIKDRARKGADVVIQGELNSFDYTDQGNVRRTGIELVIGRSGSIAFLQAKTDAKAGAGEASTSADEPAAEGKAAR